MKGDLLAGTFLFRIDVFQKRSVFNVLIRGAHYGTPSRSPLALCLAFLYISVYLGKNFIFRPLRAISGSRAAGAARGFNAKSLWETCPITDLNCTFYFIIISLKKRNTSLVHRY